MAPDLEYEAGLMRSRFAGDFARRRAARVAEACGEWPPDAVVFDEPDFGSHVAAEGLGLPYACSLCLAAGGFVRPDVVAEPVDALRAAHGLAPDPQLAAGLPSVLLPIGADQPLNAARATALGVAVALDVMRATPNEVRAAVETVLGDPRYRAAAERVRDEIAALPGPEAAVAALARIGRTP